MRTQRSHGRLSEGAIDVDFEFSADQEMLRDSVRRFLADRAPLSYVRGLYDAPATSADGVWRGLAELGVLGLGMVDSAVVLEELGRAVCPTPFIASAIGAAALAGDELLPDLVDGSRIATVALYDEGRRYEWRSPATRATPAAGPGWQLDGVKVHVPDAAAADVAIVTATDPGGALGVFAVDHPPAEPTPSVDGSRKEARLDLEATPARRIGAGDATEAVARAVDRLAVAYVVDGIGAAQRALELSVEYAKDRVQFGKPIGSFQAVQHLCADMLRAVELGRAAGYYACWALDNAGGEEAHLAATMAKAFASEAYAQVGGTAIQVFGGIGFTWEHDIHLFYKRLLSLSVTLGNADTHLAELATLVVPSA